MPGEVTASLVATASASPTATKPRGRMRRHPKLIALGAIVVIAALAGTGIAFGGFRSQEPTQAETAQRALQTSRARLQAPFVESMRLRDDLFTAERAYLSSMAEANGLIARYQKRVAKVKAENKQIDIANAPAFVNCRTYAEISCPSVVYEDQPTVPDVTASITKLRTTAAKLNSLKARLLNIDPLPELKVLNAQMLSSIENLTTNANENANVLTQAVNTTTEGEDGTGYVDEAKVKTLSGNDALPSIIQLNHATNGMIKLLQLPVGNFDVAGGHDIDSSDHSTGT